MDISDDASRILENYLKDLKSKLKNLPKSEKQETLDEMHSDILSELKELTAENPSSEIKFLFSILDKLGTPLEVADEILSKKLVSFSKQYPQRFLIFTLKTLIRTSALLLLSFVSIYLYFIGLLSFVMAALKPFLNIEMGLFTSNNSFHSYGIHLNSYLIGTGTTKITSTSEILGYWVIPLGILLGPILIYLANFIIIKTRKILLMS